MKLDEVLGDPVLYRQRQEQARRIVRKLIDRRVRNLLRPGEIERRQGERRQEPPENEDPNV